VRCLLQSAVLFRASEIFVFCLLLHPSPSLHLVVVAVVVAAVVVARSAVMSRMNHINTKAEVIEAFRVFDKDGKCVGDGLYLIVNQQDCGLTHWHCVMW
jgi:hypothetical protein